MQLSENKWYTWIMLPGYGAGFDPYISPIQVKNIIPKKTGRNILTLHFFNAFYAQGVQGFVQDLKIVGKGESYIVGKLVYEGENTNQRMAIIGEMSFPWLEKECPFMTRKFPPKEKEDVQEYLSRLRW